MTSTLHSSPLSAAGPLDLAARGWSVFPICGTVSGALCSEPEHPHNASDIGKIPPRGFKWKLKATTKANVIKVWLERFPGCNWAIDAGKSNLLVIDEDAPGELARYCADRNQEMPATLLARTAQGHHYYFRHPQTTDPIGNSNHFRDLGYAIDVRGAGGYVVAPGSAHRTGVIYKLTNTIEPIELPGWLAQVLPHQESTAQVSVLEVAEGICTPYGRTALDEWTEQLSRAPEGQRNSILNRAGFRLSQLILTNDLSPDVITAELTPVAHRIGLQDFEITKTLKSSIDGGARNPRQKRSSMTPRKLSVVRASQTRSRIVEWAWRDEGEGRLPAGELSIFAGRGGTGKSSAAFQIGAQITRGTLLGDWHGAPSDVLIYATEDSWHHTIRPRIEAASADLDRVHFICGIESNDLDTTPTPLNWREDLPLIKDYIGETGARMLIIDPVIEVVAGDSYKDQEVREALNPLVAMAHETGAIVIGITHFNKSRAADIAALLNGSVAFRNVSRTLFAFAYDKNTETHVLTQDKNNLGRDDLPSLAYEMKLVDIEIEGQVVPQPVFTITGVSPISVEDVLKGNQAREVLPLHAPGQNSASEIEKADAVSWLLSYIKSQPVHPEFGGRAAPAKTLIEDAKESGFSRATIYRARQKLGTIEARPIPGEPKNQQYWILFEVTEEKNDD